MWFEMCVWMRNRRSCQSVRRIPLWWMTTVWLLFVLKWTLVVTLDGRSSVFPGLYCSSTLSSEDTHCCWNDGWTVSIMSSGQKRDGWLSLSHSSDFRKPTSSLLFCLFCPPLCQSLLPLGSLSLFSPSLALYIFWSDLMFHTLATTSQSLVVREAERLESCEWVDNMLQK